MKAPQDSKRDSLRVIDLFCGAGGLSLGFAIQSGGRFVPVWANDNDPAAAATYNENFGDHCRVGDIIELLDDPETELPEADVVIGGPPCQGFSLLNKNRAGDPRRRMWQPFLDVVERSGATVFVMENVPHLLGTVDHEGILERAGETGFKVTSAVLTAADHGVPQTRKRAFVIGCSFADPADHFPPSPTHFNPAAPRGPVAVDAPAGGDGQKPWTTVRNAIGDLEEPVGTVIRKVKAPYDLHFGRNPTEKSLARYRAIPEEGMNRCDLQRIAPELTPGCWVRKKSGGTDLFGRLWWDRPAFTIRTEFFKPEKGRYLHPEQHRPITHREAARLQSFPDSFVFTGTKTEIARQIGNAVPPLLGGSVARCVDAMFAEAANTESLMSA